MMYGDRRYIWQSPDWPLLTYDLSELAGPLADVVRRQGMLLGRLADVGMPLRAEAGITALTDDVVKTSEIEGDHLDVESVRSSIARRLGVDIGALTPADRHTEGVVDMILDATVNHDQPVTAQRLFGWHAALFPVGFPGASRLRVGAWRDDATGPMQVVSGPIGRQRVHFEAPPAATLDSAMDRFLTWFNDDSTEPLVLKAGLAHLWFVTLHPFDDGNGRIARALGDLLLARAEDSTQRFYSLSAQIQRDRAAYYQVLEWTQRGSLEVTRWMRWYLDALGRAVEAAHANLTQTFVKARCWREWGRLPLNERQIAMLNRLLDGFTGKLTARKWAVITKCSPDTALRDITALIDFGVLHRSDAAGRSTAYELAPAGPAGDLVGRSVGT
jgi:Fic family protein